MSLEKAGEVRNSKERGRQYGVEEKWLAQLGDLPYSAFARWDRESRGVVRQG